MGAFVLGTTPLFAAIGYAVRRAGTVLGGYLTKLAAVAGAVAGALVINSSLVLSGSGVTLQKVAPSVAAAVPPALGGGKAATEGLSGQASNTDQSPPTAKLGADGIQVVDISVSYGDAEGGGAPFAPTIIQAKAGLPTRLTFHAVGDLGCAGVVVLPRKGIEKGLKPGGETTVDLGVLPPATSATAAAPGCTAASSRSSTVDLSGSTPPAWRPAARSAHRPEVHPRVWPNAIYNRNPTEETCHGSQPGT